MAGSSVALLFGAAFGKQQWNQHVTSASKWFKLKQEERQIGTLVVLRLGISYQRDALFVTLIYLAVFGKVREQQEKTEGHRWPFSAIGLAV